MRLQAQKGFTLAELILVVFLITLVVGLVAPRLSNALPGAQRNVSGRVCGKNSRRTSSSAEAPHSPGSYRFARRSLSQP